MLDIYKSGKGSVVDGNLICFHHLYNVEELLHFLTELFEAKCGYSALNTARSALSTFIKGVFQSRTTCILYTEIWDVNVVLSYLKTLSPIAKLSIKDLTYKHN